MAGFSRYDARFRVYAQPYDPQSLIWLQDGLFAAVLSAFLVFTIPQLQANSTDVAMDVLIHISQQLSNSTTPAYAPTVFDVSPYIVAINVLLFSGLSLVLTDAFLAMLVKSWLHEVDSGFRHTAPNRRAQERQLRLQALVRWNLAGLVALLPILIQPSFIFFFISLILLLFPIDMISATFSSLALVGGVTFYAFATSISVLDPYAPFTSPVSRRLRILIDALRATSISVGSWLLPPRGRETNADHSTQLLSGKDGLPQSNKGVEKRGASNFAQFDPRTYSQIAEWLVRTAEPQGNVPLLLELLDQPAKYPILRPSNVRRWEQLVCTTLELLGDPSTFSDPVARVIVRNAPFWYKSADQFQELPQSLKKHVDRMCSGQSGKRNSLLALYLHYCCKIPSAGPLAVSSTIASLEPSEAVDAELLWMVDTIHQSLLRNGSQTSVFPLALEFFAAVLTYVSSTEQSRRPQVPLTAAIIYAMHAIESALATGDIHAIEKPYVLPGIATSQSTSLTFHRIGSFDLWSGDCAKFASDLLKLQTGPGINDGIYKFQLALFAALYIDSTMPAGPASTTFAALFKPPNIPCDITMSPSEWAEAYNQTRLAVSQYMALIQEPFYRKLPGNSPSQNIGDVIMQTIQHCSEIRLSSLHLLDISVKRLREMASPSSILLTRRADGSLDLRWTAPDGPITRTSCRPLNYWILLHLETLFSPSSILNQSEFKELKWDDTPEQVYIARKKLDLYDSMQFEPNPDMLDLFLESKDYAVRTGVFKWYLNLFTPAGGIHNARMFTPQKMGSQWLEHLIRGLCQNPVSENVSSWEFLEKHLVPKLDLLPPSWSRDFALAFLCSSVRSSDMVELPAYQCFAKALRDGGRHERIGGLEGFLPFLATLSGFIKSELTPDQLISLENWTSELPEIFEHQGTHTI